ncbi:MAG TPA: YidB family protein [Dehalococcoidia bacterium]|nr:YidB family protein [Dehalococcoidia bacterium]
MADVAEKLMAAATRGKLIESVMRLAQPGSPVGGLSGLIQRLESKGMGRQAQSWVSKGENEPVSGTQVREALGDEQMRGIAARSGLSVPEASDAMAQVLPQAVDKLTDDGRVPEGSALDDRIAHLAKQFLGR